MEISTIKYQFIEEIVNINNPEIILSLKDFLKKITTKKEQPNWSEFVGIWNEDEAQEIAESIKDCETINLEEWE